MALAIVKPEMHAEWLAAMSVLGVDQAADLVRSLIPELRRSRRTRRTTPAATAPRNAAPDQISVLDEIRAEIEASSRSARLTSQRSRPSYPR
jgi:hypothetical protein